jgi:hypothetical protein
MLEMATAVRPPRPVLALGLLLLWTGPGRAAEPAPTPQEVFEKRLLPIFKSPQPSSCLQCHLSGVDLKNYILPSSEKTFRSLRDQGLIDLDAPEKSKILALIRMGAGEGGAALISEKVRQAEYEAFRVWIVACARDPELRRAPPLPPPERGGPALPLEVIRHARKDRVLESFENSVWSMRFRCMSCHREGTPECQKLVTENGERVAWIKAAGAAATLDYLRRSSLIDLESPGQSLLLLKPLGEVKHGGGKKLLPGDQGYRAFRGFIDDYVRTVKGGYADARALPPRPARERFGTDRWIKLADTLPPWGDRLLQVDLHAWDAGKGAWEAEPIATTDRLVWGKGRQWQHNLTLLADRGSERARAWRAEKQPALPEGRYLVKVYVDLAGRAPDWQAGPDSYAGAVEVRSAWPEGYGRMTVIDSGRVRR